MSPLFGGGSRGDDAGPGRPRTPEEREAARLERERRRAERTGGGTAAPAPAAPEHHAPGPAAPEHQAPQHDAPEDRAPEHHAPQHDAPEDRTPEHHGPSRDQYAVPGTEYSSLEGDPERVPVRPQPPHDPPVPVSDAPTTEHDDPFAPVEPVDAPERERETLPPDSPEEAPVGVRRVGAPSVRDLPKVAAPQPQQRPKPRGLPRQGRGSQRVLPALLLVVLALLAYGFYRYAQLFHSAGTGSVRITIPQGSSGADVADLLAKKGVVDSAFLFDLHARFSGKRGDIKAGTFTLRHDMTYGDALAVITQNPAAPPVLRVTIPEGRSIREAAPLVKQSGLRGSYVKAARHNPRSIRALKGYHVPKGTSTLEGFLFPASYELKRRSTASDLVAEQVAQFRRELETLDLREAKRKNLTAYDIVVIASMIEREAQVPKDRRLIAAVIYNRLKQHIPLGIDATLRYHLNDWSRPLRVSELQSDSPFNTRTRQGLPPTPIGSPGLASLQAAANPAHVDYLYYVVKPCGNGAHAFSSTDAQFQRDVAAYNHKRDQLGGKDPSHC